MASGFYTVMAIAPAFAAAFYMVYGDINVSDSRALLSVFGAHLAARLFAYLDERGIGSEWRQIVDQWYRTEQKPRLLTILTRQLQLQSSDEIEQTRRDIDRIQMALESF
jgi:hypothetical protein